MVPTAEASYATFYFQYVVRAAVCITPCLSMWHAQRPRGMLACDAVQATWGIPGLALLVQASSCMTGNITQSGVLKKLGTTSSVLLTSACAESHILLMGAVCHLHGHDRVRRGCRSA